MEQTADAFSVTCKKIFNGIMSLGIFMLVFVFPLYLHDAYFDVLNSKYQCYYLTVLVVLGLVVIAAIIMLLIDLKEFSGEHTKRILGSLFFKDGKKTFNVTDIAMILFWLLCAVSTLLSEYQYEAFWGNEGRYSGLFLISLYVLMYFMISRLWIPANWAFHLFLISGILMCLLGITDFFQMDIFRFHENMDPAQANVFVSTIGNINTYTACLAVFSGFSSMMFAVEKRKKLMIWYYICMVVSFIGLITGCSDNSYITLGILFGLSPFILFQYRETTGRYLVMLASLCTVLEGVTIVTQKYYDIVSKGEITEIIRKISFFPAIVIGMWLAAVLYHVFVVKNSVENTKDNYCGADETNKRLKLTIWTVICAAACIGVIIILWIANNGSVPAEEFGQFRKYLVFDNHWGSDRGYVWKKSIEIFRDFSIREKLLGYGPDTFGILTVTRYAKEMYQVALAVFDNAHNEYLHYLLTIGILGTGTYLIVLVSACVRFIKYRRKSLFLCGAAFAVICYAFQAVVNLNLPICTPMMWTMMSMGMAVCKHLE